MAKAKNKTTKAKTKSKPRSKSNSKITNNRILTIISPRAWIFIVLFALVGTFLLLRSFAETDIPTASNEIVAAYIDSKPSVLTIGEDSDNIVYESYTASYVVLGDGTIYCDDGNASGDIVAGTLPKGQLKKLHKEIKESSLDTLPTDIAAVGSETGSYVNSYEGVLLGSKEQAKAVAVYEGASMPDAFLKVKQKIVKSCSVASKKQKRESVKQIRLPELSVSAAQYNENQSAVAKIYSQLFPKANAASPTYDDVRSTNLVTNDPKYATDQFNKINAARTAAGVKPLARYECIDHVAQYWSFVMSSYTNLVHNPDYAGNIIRDCAPHRPHIVGENVGKSLGGSQSLFNAFMASPGHRTNILNPSFTHIGVGAFKNNSSGVYYVTQNFVKFYN